MAVEVSATTMDSFTLDLDDEDWMYEEVLAYDNTQTQLVRSSSNTDQTTSESEGSAPRPTSITTKKPRARKNVSQKPKESNDLAKTIEVKPKTAGRKRRCLSPTTTSSSSDCVDELETEEVVEPEREIEDLLVLSNNRPVRRMVLPRIVKRDVRRSYAAMFTNVYNACDFDFMTSFLDTFCRRQCSYVMRKIPLTQLGTPEDRHVALHLQHGKIGIPLVHLTDLETIGQLWFHSMNESPDMLFSLGDTQFKLRTDGTGSVTFRYTVQGNKVLTVQPNQPPPKVVCPVSGEPELAHSTAMEYGQIHTKPLPVDNEAYIASVTSGSTEKELSERIEKDLQLDDTKDSGELLRLIDERMCEAGSQKKQCGDIFAKTVIPTESPNIVLVPYSYDGSISLYFDPEAMIYAIDYHITK